jgi:hypothetical protein
MADQTPVPVKKIPPGVRALPEPKREEKPAKFAAELCGSGDRILRFPRLDEMDLDHG